jgi:hypothetical protein
MSIRKVKMATAMLILFNASLRGLSIGVFKKPQFLCSQKLCTCLGQQYHLEWYFLMCPAQTIRVLIDTGSSGDLLFVRKQSDKYYIPTAKRALSQLWGASNGTIQKIKWVRLISPL